jgi:lipopolysaccharide biosynthesis glycosyltransferase
MRSNSDFIFVGQLNKASVEILTAEYLAGSLEKKEFIQMFNQSTKDYNFLLINNNSVKNNEDIHDIYGMVRCPESFL